MAILCLGMPDNLASLGIYLRGIWIAQGGGRDQSISRRVAAGGLW